MNTRTDPAVAEYLARTRAALADLPAAELEEIVEDIGPHLSEIAAEVDGDVTVDALSERLGTPEQYAAELRAAAGYPSAESAPPRRSTALPRFVLWALVLSVLVAFGLGLAGIVRAIDAISIGLLFSLPLFAAWILIFNGRVAPSAVADLPEALAGRRVVESLPDNVIGYLRSLRPAWWLIRIVVLALALLAIFGHAGAANLLWPIIALVVLIWFGPKARTDRRWTWVVAPANAFAVGIALALLGLGWANAVGSPYRPQSGVIIEGRQFDNVYVFGPDGKPLTEVYLYDENGIPITVPVPGCNGWREPTNKMPVPRVEFDMQGMCREVTGVPFTVAIPTASTAPTTTTVPTPTTPPPTTTPGK
ncbi:MAG TPA: hypothetical protein VGX25_27730 [Actinophytocola sp.]|uniref:DUF1700 domain-containing protein n=1 Tax=Actinophytocola sp. TaxID=1872138 RepID=UPI002DDD14FC|nr:hypothetical protein [Actinophytocola sp.]HEV2783191.1 hypothetical protein [Actinophytocola sp.]